MNRDDEEPRQRGGIVLAPWLAARLRTRQCLGKNRLGDRLMIATKMMRHLQNHFGLDNPCDPYRESESPGSRQRSTPNDDGLLASTVIVTVGNAKEIRQRRKGSFERDAHRDLRNDDIYLHPSARRVEPRRDLLGERHSVFTTISTRRFFWRLAGLSVPSGLVFGTTGFDSPQPRVAMAAVTLCEASHD